MDLALKALAEPHRREILRIVWSHELPAASIAASFDDVTRSAISQHLGVLREADLVVERRDGVRRLYQANRKQIDHVRRFLLEFWDEKLDRLRDVAESAEQRKGNKYG